VNFPVTAKHISKSVCQYISAILITKPTGHGTGLRLLLSCDSVKAHGGEIKVNTSEEEFTEFIILLPT
jgi:nitrogen-specific signal transduction histidine kinase